MPLPSTITFTMDLFPGYDLMTAYATTMSARGRYRIRVGMR
jgi:hypothetical protein